MATVGCVWCPVLEDFLEEVAAPAVFLEESTQNSLLSRTGFSLRIKRLRVQCCRPFPGAGGQLAVAG